MKVLFAIKSVAGSGGGAERVLADVTSELAARGHQILVASFDRPDVVPFYAFGNVRRIELGVGKVDARSAAQEVIGRALALRGLARAQQVDVAVGFMHSAYVPLALGLIGSAIPVVASEHIAFDYYRTRPVERQLLRVGSVLSAGMTVQSESVRAGFPDRLRRHMTVIPNPAGLRIAAPRAAAGDHQRKTVLAVGRLDEQKDHRTLIEAFARVAERFPDWDLMIVGDGRLRAGLEQDIGRRHLEDRVRLPGFLADVGPEYRSADVYAMPSLYESFGLATAEALASGLPAIGFADCPGTNELILPGVNGLLVSGADRVHALADGLSKLMESEKLRARLGGAAAQSVAQYALGPVVDRWEELLRMLAER